MVYHQFEDSFSRPQSEEATEHPNSRFLSENCLVALLATTMCVKADGKANSKIESGDFDKKFGKEVGDVLRQIGAENVQVDGDSVKLHLKDVYNYDVNQGGLNRARLQKDLSFKVNRDGGTISLSDIQGIDLDFGRFAPWVGLPDMKLSKGNIEIVTPIKNISLSVPDAAFENIDALLKKIDK